MMIKKNYFVNFTFLMLSSSTYITAKELHITLPNVPTVPKVNAKVISPLEVIVHNSNFKKDVKVEEYNISKKGILFTKRVPPNYNKILPKKKENNSLVGEVSNNRVSVYLLSAFISVDDVIDKLKDSGFDILAKYTLDKDANYISIIFTNKSMLSGASKETRGFASSLRLLIDKKNNIVSINNPLYIMKAFMQDDYDDKLAKELLKSIKNGFEDLKDSSEVMKFSHLSEYQFMTGMPYYEDMLEIASKSNEELLRSARNSNKVVYEQKLDNGATVLAIKLSDSTSKFVETIGYENSELLPYPILIENNKAKILSPKYYIALMYPSLSMSQFMSISEIPGDIEKDCDKIFR